MAETAAIRTLHMLKSYSGLYENLIFVPSIGLTILLSAIKMLRMSKPVHPHSAAVIRGMYFLTYDKHLNTEIDQSATPLTFIQCIKYANLGLKRCGEFNHDCMTGPYLRVS